MLFDNKDPVQMKPSGIYINGEPTIVLCSSLFYFRIPKGLWRDRLKKVKAAGYNCIDVYFPWNYHETVPGEWDFTGEKDVEEFLQLAKLEGLWVVARPGPYICSEWDGGGLPAYLFVDQSMKVRDNDSKYLHYVSKWFDKILPLLHKYEQGNEGTIITIQLENELDFYECNDREGYISALKGMAVRHHISVPLFACAGQGDIFGATGFAEKVMPACNFYPHDKEPHVEAKVLTYYHKLQDSNYPLCVSETNRSHYLLRRLLSVGVKLLGPYNQVSGTDFGFTNSINNWGDPLAFLTSDYDFGGMISPEGNIRPEFYEARLLSQFINSLGSTFAEATPCEEKLFFIQSEMTTNDDGPYALSLKKGGKALFIPNLDEIDHQAVITKGEDTFPKNTKLTIPVNRCPIVLCDIPMQTWNLAGYLHYTTAELGYTNKSSSEITMIFHSENEAEICMELPDDVEITSDGIQINNEGSKWTFVFSIKQISDSKKSHLRLMITYNNGVVLNVICMDRKQASSVKGISDDGSLIGWKDKPNKKQVSEKAVVQTNWNYYQADEEAWLKGGHLVDKPVPMETKGYYKGYGWYSSKYNNHQLQSIQGILLHGASDVVSLYCNSDYQGTSIPGGGFQFYPLKSTTNHLDIKIRSEIWGHSNFNSPLLPSLGLNALKGIEGLTIIHQKESLLNEWSYLPVDNELSKIPKVDDENPLWKSTEYDVFLTNSQPKKGYYYKELRINKGYDHHILSFEGIDCTGKVYVDGVFINYINPLNPYIDLSNNVLLQNTKTHLVVYLEQYYGQSGGNVLLLSGNKTTQWEMYGLAEKGLAEKSLQKYSPDQKKGNILYSIKPGEVHWLHTTLIYNEPNKKCLIADVVGKNAKLTVFFNQTIVGRIWLKSESRPYFSGGAQSRFYLPSTLWRETDNELKVLVEAVELEENASIEDIQFKEV